MASRMAAEKFADDLHFRQGPRYLHSLQRRMALFVEDEGRNDIDPSHVALPLYVRAVLVGSISRRTCNRVLSDEQAVAVFTASCIANRWLASHAGSKAARAVSQKHIDAEIEQHYQLLREMWPAIVYFFEA